MPPSARESCRWVSDRVARTCESSEKGACQGASVPAGKTQARPANNGQTTAPLDYPKPRCFVNSSTRKGLGALLVAQRPAMLLGVTLAAALISLPVAAA